LSFCLDWLSGETLSWGATIEGVIPSSNDSETTPNNLPEHIASVSELIQYTFKTEMACMKDGLAIGNTTGGKD
jgi:hypothetical protein